MFGLGKFTVLVIALAVSAFSQQLSDSNVDPSDKQTARPKTSDYLGNRFRRAALGFQYQYQYVQQPQSVLVNQPGNTQLLTSNPERNLNQHTFTYDFSQVILTPAERARIRKLVPDYCSDGDAITCVANGGGFGSRLLYGLKLIANISEHPVATQGFILPAGYLFGGEVDLTPEGFFTTGSDWKTITAGIKDEEKATLLKTLNSPYCKVPKADSKDENADAKDKFDTINCAYAFLKFHGPTRQKWYWALSEAMIPTFQYKRLTPFDFLKYAGTLIPSENTGGLNSFSITVDLRRLFASPTSRLDAIDAADAIRSPSGTVSKTKLCGVIFTGGSISLISVPGETSKESCVATAKALKAEQFELGCTGGKETILGTSQPTENPDWNKAVPSGDSCGWNKSS